MIRKVEKLLIGVCRVGTGLGFLTLIVAVTTQVVGRSILNDSPPWTEELTRYAMLWTVAFAAGLSFRSGDLVNVDIVSEALPGRLSWVSRLLAATLTFGLCAALLGPAWKYTSIGQMQTSPVLLVRMTWIHASVLALLVLLMVFAAFRILDMVLRTSDGRPESDT